jgi:acyl dehydratase/NADP-dependent 3-hydroxy acid dehydrogenase YdfG
MVDERTFDLEDQRRFAGVSGDRNPIHLDPYFARRTQFGAPIVHGMHLVLAALESLAASNRLAGGVVRLSARFMLPVFLGERVTFRLTELDSSRRRIAVLIGPTVAATVNFQIQSRESVTPNRHPKLDNEAIERGVVRFDERVGIAAECFPALARQFGAIRTASLAALSEIVGMKCPGLHSIFSGFSVTMEGEDGDTSLTYAVENSNADLGVVRLSLSGSGISGALEAFVRGVPREQPTFANARAMVSCDEFAGTTALVTGGSRGIGEAAAKLLAAGGAHVIVTYALGREDAARISEEITEGGGRCEFFHYDVLKPAVDQIRALPVAPTQVYYFATGAIFDRRLAIYDADRFRRFSRIYVDGFADLCLALTASFQGPIKALYPSSVVVANPTPDMLEYAMAKAAGEALCHALNSAEPRLSIDVRRLPRIRTDQTSSIRAIPDVEAFDVLLPILREIQSGSAVARK